MRIGVHPHARLGHMEALEGAVMIEKKLEVAANNMANVDTTGFKKQRITFKEYFLPQVDNTERTAKGAVIKSDFSLGAHHKTDNPLDIAIEGEGFFVIQTPDGLRYTRDGSFVLDGQKQLVTRDGYPVLGNGAPIILDDTTGRGIWLSNDGNFFVDETQTGTIDVVTFKNPGALKRLGNNLFAPIPEAGDPQPVENIRVKQGFLEDSNVNPLEAMLEVIDVYRGYEAQQKTLQTIDQLDNKAINDMGKPA